MSLDMWKVNAEALDKYIFKEFNKTKKDLNEYMNIMREWSKTQPHFPEVPDDRVLRFVVLYNKFSVEKAKQRLDMYYTIRSLIPEYFRCIPLSEEMLIHCRVFYCVVLPKVTPDFKRIVYTKMNPNYEVEMVNHDRIAEVVINLFELIIQKDECFNFHYIFDCEGVQIGHFAKINPMAFRRLSVIMEKVFSNRIASLYIVNFAKFMETILNNIVKPALNPKIRDRIIVHRSADILLQTFGKETMPKDIGGEEKSLEELTDLIVKTYEEQKDRFKTLGALRVDESLRPNKLVNDDILGYHGNFKTINLD